MSIVGPSKRAEAECQRKYGALDHNVVACGLSLQFHIENELDDRGFVSRDGFSPNTSDSVTRDFVLPSSIIPKHKTEFTSLPEELIRLVFRTAVRLTGTKQAVRISHVSRMFRIISLTERCLWSTLHSAASKSELEAFIARCGNNTDLHVVLRISPRRFDLHAFITTCLHTMAYWHSLTVSEEMELRPTDISAHFLLKTLDRSYSLHLPRLNKLSILAHHGPSSRVPEAGIRFSPSWYSPNIHTLRCVNFVPSPSPSLSSITSLSLSLRITLEGQGAIHIGMMLSFLTSFENVKEVDVEINGISAIDSMQAVRLEEAVLCPSIKQLSLHLLDLPNGHGCEVFVENVCEPLSVPNIENLTISIGFHSSSFLEKSEGARAVEKIEDAIFRWGERNWSHLKTLSFEVLCEVLEASSYYQAQAERLSLFLSNSLDLDSSQCAVMKSLNISTRVKLKLLCTSEDGISSLPLERFYLDG